MDILRRTETLIGLDRCDIDIYSHSFKLRFAVLASVPVLINMIPCLTF